MKQESSSWNFLSHLFLVSRVHCIINYIYATCLMKILSYLQLIARDIPSLTAQQTLMRFYQTTTNTAQKLSSGFESHVVNVSTDQVDHRGMPIWARRTVKQGTSPEHPIFLENCLPSLSARPNQTQDGSNYHSQEDVKSNLK